MKKFLLGFLIGIFISVGIYFLPHADPRFRVNIGRLLDEDVIYLQNGGFIKGWIISEENGQILIEGRNGTFDLSLDKCRVIKRNYLLQYVRELM